MENIETTCLLRISQLISLIKLRFCHWRKQRTS